ncbi:TetR/AcrR family transcriptional regulator [Pseudoduganella lutea]|nr:TetR/AcrR family transcriptional regulator [Pseudoduganella lutea]
MTEPRRGRGRPRKLEAADALLDAGRDLLLTHGMRVTVDAIVARAGVAKTTFYTYFADKEAFIEAVMLRESARTISDQQFRDALDGEVRETLVRFGSQYLAFANEVRLSAWDRLIASANDIYPELARRLYDAGPGRGYRLLTDILREADRKGVLLIPDPVAAAEELTGIWYGTTILRVNLKVMPPMTPEEIQRRAVRGVEVLYRLYGSAQ